jgi:hypothetical protein
MIRLPWRRAVPVVLAGTVDMSTACSEKWAAIAPVIARLGS